MNKNKKFINTTRRNFVSGVGLVAAGIALKPLSLFAQDEATTFGLYSPKNYLSNKLVSKINNAIDPEINLATYSSPSSFSVSSGTYDVIIGRDSSIENLIDEEKLLELNNDLISNKTFIDKKFLASSFDPERKYSIPLSYGAIGIAYRKSKFSEPPSTWRWLLDSDKYAGKIALIGDGRTLIQLALKYMGVSLNTNDPMWINQAEKLLKRQKENVKDFGKKNGKELLISGEVDMAILSNEDYKTIDDNDIEFTFPREGSLIWQDCASILKSSSQPNESHSVINSLLEPKNGKLLAENIQFATPNIMALDMCKDSYKENHTIFPNAQIIERYEDTSTILDFDYEMMIEEMWDNILSA
jgi:spermidine/putrescine transport system substrate-binding protein